MATIKVRSFTVVRDVLGSPVIEVEVPHPETVEGTLDSLLRQYNGALRELIVEEYGEITPFLIRLKEEIISSTLDKNRTVKTGDEISIIFPIGGGS